MDSIIGLTAAPQIGLYNRHSQTQVLTYTTASPATSVKEKPVSDFAVSYAIPVSLSVAYSF